MLMADFAYSKLSASPEEADVEHQVQIRYPQSSLRRRVAFFILFALSVLGNLYSLLTLRERNISQECIRPQKVETPATENAISYTKKRLERDIDQNPYTGEPRPEFDDAWRHIVEPLTMNISRSELSKLGQTTIPFADGSGFLAEMAVYHELHCIKRIRRHLYIDHYYPNQTDDEKRREKLHVDHCLEYWREAAMCRADPALATFQWAEGKPFSRVWSEHECVDWERFDSWARTRMVDLSDYSILADHEEAADGARIDPAGEVAETLVSDSHHL